ncbi:MAG: hypothetical protein ACJA08_001425 [Cyclobacteriaceae bacterium]|jgi:hypothetical protein
MKNLFTIMLILLVASGFAQNQKYIKAMMTGKSMIGQADTITELVAAANYFERIAQNEKEEWLPNYYQGQALTFAGLQVEKEARETYLNSALDCIKNAASIERNAELVAMEGFIQMMRLSVDPATRGRILSPTIYALFREALLLDPNNPRAQLFMGQMEFGSAQFFGSGTEKSCEYIQRANSLFAKESTDDTIFPNWGNKTALGMAENCNQ